MFIKSKNYDACIQKVRIEVGSLVGLEKDEEAYILLKELPTLQMLTLKESSEKGENHTLALLKDLLPSILVDHNFYEDANAQKKMRNEDVANLIFESLDLTVKVVNEYTHAGFFTHAQRKGAKSPHSVQKSSTEEGASRSSEHTGIGCPT
jgi:hypothetical protein